MSLKQRGDEVPSRDKIYEEIRHHCVIMANFYANQEDEVFWKSRQAVVNLVQLLDKNYEIPSSMGFDYATGYLKECLRECVEEITEDSSFRGVFPYR